MKRAAARRLVGSITTVEFRSSGRAEPRPQVACGGLSGAVLLETGVSMPGVERRAKHGKSISRDDVRSPGPIYHRKGKQALSASSNYALQRQRAHEEPSAAVFGHLSRLASKR